jgi:hypothetical protein
MWPLYITQAEKHDQQLTERWKRQTDTTLNVVRASRYRAVLLYIMVLGWIFLHRRFHISGHSHWQAQAKFVGIAARTSITSTCPAVYPHILSTSTYPTRSSHKAGHYRERVVDP